MFLSVSLFSMFYVMFVLGFYFTNRRDDLGPLFWPLASCIALRAVVESFRFLFPPSSCTRTCVDQRWHRIVAFVNAPLQILWPRISNSNSREFALDLLLLILSKFPGKNLEFGSLRVPREKRRMEPRTERYLTCFFARHRSA